MKNIYKVSTMVNKTLVWVVVMLLTIHSAFAQDDPTALPDAPDDTAATPIDGYVWVLALIGLLYVFLRFKALPKGNPSSEE